MRKTHEQVKAELLARRDRYLAQRRRRRKAAVALAASAVCLVAVLAVALPRGIPSARLPVQEAGTTKTGIAHTTVESAAPDEAPEETQPTVPDEEPVEPVVSSTAATQTTTRLTNVTRPSMVTHPSRPGATGNTTTAPATTACTSVRFTQAPHGSDRPYRGAVAAFAPAYVRLPYEGNAVQELTAEATALWEFSVRLTDRPRKTEIGDEMIGARYVIFRDADGYELTCLYCDTCVGLGNNWYDITAQEAAALDALLSALL